MRDFSRCKCAVIDTALILRIRDHFRMFWPEGNFEFFLERRFIIRSQRYPSKMKIGNLSFERMISIESDFLETFLGQSDENLKIQSQNHYGNTLDIEKFAFDIVNI